MQGIIILLLSVMIYFNSKKVKEDRVLLEQVLLTGIDNLNIKIEEINDVQKQENRKINDKIDKLNTKIYETNKDINDGMCELNKQASKNNNYIKELMSSRQAINEDEIHQWIKLVEKRLEQEQIEEALGALDSAIDKYPASRLLLELYGKVIGPLIKSEDTMVKRDSLKRYNRVVELFFNHCCFEDWEFAFKVKRGVNSIGDNMVNVLQQKRISRIKDIISEFENQVEDLMRKKQINEIDIQRLNKIDESIEKQLLIAIPDLESKYHNLSKRVLEKFKTDQENSQENKQAQYNKRAIEAAKIALDRFNDFDSKHIDQNQLQQIVSKLGVWERNYFYPSTALYHNTVYQQIFSELSNENKLKITRLMADTLKKEIIG